MFEPMDFSLRQKESSLRWKEYNFRWWEFSFRPNKESETILQ
jgi:hypothetical protein